MTGMSTAALARRTCSRYASGPEVVVVHVREVGQRLGEALASRATDDGRGRGSRARSAPRRASAARPRAAPASSIRRMLSRSSHSGDAERRAGSRAQAQVASWSGRSWPLLRRAPRPAAPSPAARRAASASSRPPAACCEQPPRGLGLAVGEHACSASRCRCTSSSGRLGALSRAAADSSPPAERRVVAEQRPVARQHGRLLLLHAVARS